MNNSQTPLLRFFLSKVLLRNHDALVSYRAFETLWPFIVPEAYRSLHSAYRNVASGSSLTHKRPNWSLRLSDQQQQSLRSLRLSNKVYFEVLFINQHLSPPDPITLIRTVPYHAKQHGLLANSLQATRSHHADSPHRTSHYFLLFTSRVV